MNKAIRNSAPVLLHAKSRVVAFPQSTETSPSERAVEFQVISLPALLKMKLIAWRLKDRVHLLDMIGVGLIDSTWPSRYPPPLNERLQQLFDNPNG